MVATQASRRLIVTFAAAAVLKPLRTPAESNTAVPTFSLKGVPGLSNVLGADAPPPVDLGVIGRGTNKDKTGRLNQCTRGRRRTTHAHDKA